MKLFSLYLGLWHDPYPNYQYAPIQNLIAFPQEGVDEFYVDGELLSAK
jgi:hypothetical protein